ncbi:DUF4007 family protein [Pseudobutyrivibrio sp. LB2011]|uniref:DUF4007 family protein n=1 Tax=Pseudobutyrivibrio sp. LB2011 TaxID=1408312 RepID=UPI0005D13C94|nr:DUF4007 family protein [Pseudobutyrivibrio sp. LB2011]
MKIKGHEKFVLREGWLTKGIRGVSEDDHLFSGNDGADKLGVGTNMVKSIRYWMQAFDLLDEDNRTGVRLNKFGEIILDNDLYLEDDFTLWLLHSRIAKNSDRATTWYVFFNNVDAEDFSKEEIFEPVKRELLLLADKEFPDKSLADDIDVLLNMYSREKKDEDPEDKNVCPLVELGLIKKDGNRYVRQQPDLRKFSDYIILYELSSLLNGKKSISIDVIADTAKHIYQLNRVTVNNILDRLDSAGYIRVDRTAGLDLIYPDEMIESEKVIEEYYKGR